jgi:hypothetical protein
MIERRDPTPLQSWMRVEYLQPARQQHYESDRVDPMGDANEQCVATDHASPRLIACLRECPDGCRHDASSCFDFDPIASFVTSILRLEA